MVMDQNPQIDYIKMKLAKYLFSTAEYDLNLCVDLQLCQKDVKWNKNVYYQHTTFPRKRT